MRPDTPQHYEYITVEDVEGKVANFININPWTQFFDLKGRKDIPLSRADHILIRNCRCECDTYFNVKKDENQYFLTDFTFENLSVKTKHNGFAEDVVKDMVVSNVRICVQ